MRTISTLFVIAGLAAILIFTSCGKDDNANPPAGAAFKGDFVSGAHSTSGVATIDSNETTLTLTNFNTDSGPDLNIYIVSDITHVTTDFIDLGDIKGRNGTYTYNLPANKDYLIYKYVVVWCVDFDVNFGYAELVKQ